MARIKIARRRTECERCAQPCATCHWRCRVREERFFCLARLEWTYMGELPAGCGKWEKSRWESECAK